MGAISLVSCSGAPGVTTVALATTAALTATTVPEPVMIEMASSGGVVASQYDLPSEPGLASLSLALGGAPPNLLTHAQELPGGIPVVVAPASNSKTEKLLQARAALMAEYLAEADATVLVDCGRISSTTALRPVLNASTLVAIVVSPSRENFQLSATTLAEVNAQLTRPMPAGWVIVGSCPWSQDEIVDQYGIPVLSVIAEDRMGAEAVAGRRRLRRRSPLARSVQSFADDIAKHLRVATPSSPLGYLASDEPGREAPASSPTASDASTAASETSAFPESPSAKSQTATAATIEPRTAAVPAPVAEPGIVASKAFVQ